MTAKLAATSRPFPSGRIAANYSHLCLLYACALIFALGSCTVQRVEPPAAPPNTVRLPWLIHEGGGFYIPWNANHERAMQGFLACMGLEQPPRPRPTLWVSPFRIFTDSADRLFLVHPTSQAPADSLETEKAGLYFSEWNAIVFSPAIEGYEHMVFLHELLHWVEQSASPRGFHDALFTRALSCGTSP